MSGLKLQMIAGLLVVALLGCQNAESPRLTDDSAASGDSSEASSPLTESTAEQPSQEIGGTEVTAARAVTPPDTPAEQGSTEESNDNAEETAKLGIGDPAPPLTIDAWVTGEPVASLHGQPYVVEFWATWCGPCRTSMPHLSELAARYGDELTVIGVTREDAATVEEFLDEEQSEGKTWREVVSYRLAIDQNDQTSQAWMTAAQQRGIPTAFIVGREGIIEWIGHPMTMDEPLAAIVDGTFDRQSALAARQQQEKMQQTMDELRQLLRNEDHAEAIEMIDSLGTELPPGLLLVKVQLLKQEGRDDEALSLQKQFVEDVWNDAAALNHIAWGIATGALPQDLVLANRAAMQAVELTGERNAAVLDTLARVHYEQGNLEEAIVWQEKAVGQAAGQDSFRETLESYQGELKTREENTKPADEEAAQDDGRLENPEPEADQ